MPTWDDVTRIARELPGAVEGTSYGNAAWKVRGGAAFAWVRPLRSRDLDELGDAAPEGTVIGVRVPGPELKAALCEAEGPAVFTVAHFDGFDAVLVHLDAIDPALLEDLVVASWHDRAPAKLRAQLAD